MADESEDPVIQVTKELEKTIDEFDDTEFDIPTVDNPPTLESILNEPDDISPVDEDADATLPSSELFQGDPGDSVSVSSLEGIQSDRSRRKSPRKSKKYEKHGSIIRHVILKGVSAQIMSAADRVDAGMPTAMAVSSLIAVGTSHGVSLVFDPKQVLKWCLGSTAVGAEYGAISAMTFNKDCTRLLCGFAKGQITMWDLTNGKLLRTITDAHPPGTACLNVKFTDDLTVAVCSDSGGSVFELEMKRLIGVRTCESKCLFSGSRGEVCTIEPLHMQHKVQDHPMKDCIVLAMASLSKVIIVTLRPQLKVMFMHPLKGDPGTLPLLAWQFVIIQVSERDRVIDPVLAFARDTTIYYYQVVCHSAEDIRFAPLQKTELPYKLLSITWMNSRTLLLMDTSERVHVMDVRTEEELEVIDLTDVQLVYSTSFYKSLATGGNVSKALAFAGERAVYNSLMTYNGQLVMLGTKGVHVLTVRNWIERIEVYLKQDKLYEAITLAGSFYDGKAKAVCGLTGRSYERKQRVSEKLVELLDMFVDQAVARSPKHGKIEDLEEYYQNVVPVCVENCLKLDRADVLFGSIYDRFSGDPIAKGTFLECLEPYILNDQLTSITPSVMQDLVSHYQSKGMLRNVESCIVHMDIASLDIHQVVVLCWEHGLYDAILYIYNKGMKDYTTPLEELLVVLRQALAPGKQLSDEHVKLGNKLLVYISCCLAGRAYPLGDIPEEEQTSVKDSVFQSVSCLHTREPNEEEPVYPNLKTLLQFDTREFFNVLALAFEEPEFNTDEGVEKRQRVVDILLQIMVESVGFTPTQIGILFTFLARQMARHENTIIVNRVLFEQVLESLCAPGDDSRHEERQQALMELLQAGGLQHFDEGRLLSLAENAKFYRICELMYEKRRDFSQILLLYLKDTPREHHVFRYIEQIMTGEGFTVCEKMRVQQEAFDHLKDLVRIDSRKTANLVLVNFSNNISEVVETLKEDEMTLYAFLQGVFEARDINHGAIYIERQIQIEPEIHEMYIDMMCTHSPKNVCGYLRANEGYRLEETLEICRRHQILDAIAYLLEKAGDIHGAFNIIIQNLESSLKEFSTLVSGSQGTSKEDIESAWSAIPTVLEMVIHFCQRNSGNMAETEREKLWFPLLEEVMGPQRKLKNNLSQEQQEGFKDLTRHVLDSMMGYIPLPAILQKVMQDPTYSTGRFGEIRELILGMLETYNYEKTLLHTCNNLVNHDLHYQVACLAYTAKKGIVPRQNQCSLCNKPYVGEGENENVICFRCGHGYHQPCLKSTGSRHLVEGEEIWLCFICNSSRRGGGQQVQGRLQRHSSSSASIMTSSKQTTDVEQSLLDAAQITAIDNLRKSQKTASGIKVLSELSKQKRGGSAMIGGGTNILQHESFQLRLSYPPPEFA